MDATVTENTIVLADSLAVGDWFMCAASHILTSGDIDDLERDSFATGFAKDWYDFEVSASDAEVVKLNQVRTTVWIILSTLGPRGRGVVGCDLRHVG